MNIIQSPKELYEKTNSWRLSGKSVGLVPTMGNLHEGHLSLIRQSVRDNDFTVVTLFVNPAQFGQGEDFEKYPRTFETDCAVCSEAGADVLFAPMPDDIYPEGFETYVEVGPIAQQLCGASRPGHFRGVATIVLKIFNLSCPSRAYFGLKDYQQVRVIQRMVDDFNLPIQIIPMAIIREPDGLAISSRNNYLSAEERSAALVLKRSLDVVVSAWNSGERSAENLRQALIETISGEPLAKLDYAEISDPITLRPLAGKIESALASLAVYIGTTRLIDNTVLR